jgi:hypothetical protein
VYRFNEPHKYKAGNRIFTGRITDISNTGILSIEDENCKIKGFSFKEIDFVL